MRISLKHWLRVRRDPWRKIFYTSFKAYKKADMERRRYEFGGLNADSVVLDFGGFEGTWAFDIHQRYGSKIHVFEPHPRFFDQILQRLGDNEKYILHEFAIGSEPGHINLSDTGDASSAFIDDADGVQGEIRAATEFFKGCEDRKFDLAKINIEGGEYDLLPALIDCGVVKNIKTLQVQFHLYTEADIATRAEIVARLEKTHDPDWSYPFVWEQWTRKGG